MYALHFAHLETPNKELCQDSSWRSSHFYVPSARDLHIHTYLHLSLFIVLTRPMRPNNGRPRICPLASPTRRPRSLAYSPTVRRKDQPQKASSQNANNQIYKTKPKGISFDITASLGIPSHQSIRIGGHTLTHEPTNPYESSHELCRTTQSTFMNNQPIT